MAKQTIDIGSTPNKGDGDPLRTAFTKINQNFNELYAGGFADPESIGANISPDTDAAYNLGAADKQWADVHISDFLYLNGQRIEALPNGALLVNGSGAREAADIVGSVFGDDSTLLVDGVNNLIPSNVVSGIEADRWSEAYSWGDHSVEGYLTTISGTVTGSLIPNTNIAYDLGSDTNRFRDLYLSGSTIDLGGTTLSIVGGELQLGGVKIPTTVDLADGLTINASGDVQGSVFADDSTLLVDGVNGKIVGPIDTATITASALNLNISARNYVYVDSNEGGSIVIGQTASTGPVVVGKASGIFTVNSDAYFNGDINVSTTGSIKTSDTDQGLIIEGPSWANWVPSPGAGGGYASISNGVNIVTHRAGTDEERVWSFAGDGALYAPFQADNYQIGAIEWRQTAPYDIINQIRTTVGNGVDQFPGMKLITLPNTVTDDVAITLTAGFDNNWIFKNDGSLQIAGDIKSEKEINISVNLTDSTTHTWRFGEDGDLSFPDGSTQITAYPGPPTGFFNGDTGAFVLPGGNVVFQVDGQSPVAVVNSEGIDVNKITTGSSVGGDDLTIVTNDGGNIDIDAATTGVVSLASQSGELSIGRVGGTTDVYGEVEFNNGTTLFQAGNTVTFNTDINLNGTVIMSGDIRSENAVNIDINLSDSILHRWTFGEDGNTEFPGAIAASSVIAQGIRANEVTVEGAGDNLVIAGGAGTTDGGNIGITAGAAGTGSGGNIGITAGTPDQSGQGGNINLIGGFGREGDGGDINIAGGPAVGSSGGGGVIYLNGGHGLSAGDGGNIQIIAGGSSVAGGGDTLIAAGGGLTSGGDLTLLGGSGATGGDLIIEAGQGPNDPGNVFIKGGLGVDGYRGDLTIEAGHVEIGSEGDISININLSDSTQRTWRFGEDGDLTFPDNTNQSTAFTGNAATIDITDTNGIDTNYYLTFVENRDGGEILRADVDLIFNSADNTLTAGNITTGILKINDGVHETLALTAGIGSGVNELDCSLGHITYNFSVGANWTVNLTNLNLDEQRATTVTIVIDQGETGYYPNALQIAGQAQTIRWQGNTLPTPSTSRVDVVTFSILRTGVEGAEYTVLGQLTGF